ncbi:MAG TPA: ABC transporter permease [Candidatus Limnocylindrales bacterium]|jgi:ABC-2 type transport system permease protein
MTGWRTLLPNAWYVAVREYRSRVRTRSFLIGTVALAAIAFIATQLPVVFDLTMSTSQTRVAMVVPSDGLPSDAFALMSDGLNGQPSSPGSRQPYAISWLPGGDPTAVQKDLEGGKLDALLIVERDATTKDLAFTLRTDIPRDGRVVATIGTAVASLQIEDRLFRAGTSTAALRAPYSFKVEPVKATSVGANSVSEEISTSLLSTGLIVLIFMAIITYGVWVATSVAEEKGSRVMELMLNATTPLQMLTGKVMGNGAAGLTQYGVILGAVVGGLLAQGPIHKIVVGTDAAAQFGGLSPTVLTAFVVLFVLGFLLYSLLYAALGSLVSRQEDVQSATSPLMTLIMIGYFMSVFGLQTIDAAWVKVASFVPFFSPYLMLARVSTGHVEIWEFVLAVVLLVASIAVALFVAARIYSAGVLLYGQRVGLRQLLKMARVSR